MSHHIFDATMFLATVCLYAIGVLQVCPWVLLLPVGLLLAGALQSASQSKLHSSLDSNLEHSSLK